MTSFDFYPRTRIVFGPGKVAALGELAGELGARRVLVVSDPGIVKVGHSARAIKMLEQAGIEGQLFDTVGENPTTEHVEAGLKVAKRWEPELIVGLGGGSSMDCAKGINFLYTNGGQMQDYWGIGKATKPMLPMIAVPTTAGTGSETQSFALISDAKTHVKMACGDKKASFRVALLDPELTLTQPARVTALTGIDAVAHALESYVCRTRNPASMAFSREAWLALGGNFAHVLAQPSDLAARGGMQLGACFSGLAIENSMLGAAHALANPLTASFNIAHGQAVGMMLPHVIRFNGEEFGNLYFELLECTAGGNGFPAPAAGYQGLADFVAELLQQAGLLGRLREFKIPAEKLESLAADAAKQWTAEFNPRKAGVPELLSLYQAAY
ncbi:MAG TPA: iron-containing alcohol dehydrogenase [Pirellulales bacterium]|nr:iron-containing alcohol dehydrogenase [Pirellulales bacterium]